MHEEAPFYLIAHSVTFQPIRKEVKGFVMTPISGIQWNKVDLD